MLKSLLSAFTSTLNTSRGQEEGKTEKVIAKEFERNTELFLGGGETDGTKSSPMEVCSGGPMLPTDRR